MALKIFERIFGKNGRVEAHQVSVEALCAAAEEYRARELAFHCCVNMVARALGRCEFRTFSNNKEVRKENYWIWNYAPNTNQNSTTFLHKLVYRLYRDNEALIIPMREENGQDAWAVADQWDAPEHWPDKQTEYKGVTVEDMTYPEPFLENKVLHLTLHYADIGPVLRGLCNAYEKLIQSAIRSYLFTNGQHWKVHVSQLASGQENWAENFQEMLDAQVKPFLESERAILPETDGYQYENVDKTVEGGLDAAPIRKLYTDVFEFTANAFGIPPVLLMGQVQETEDAMSRFLTACLDPLADQLGEEITRKIYGFELWKQGSYLRVDTSAVNHFDLIANAPNVEKLMGSGYSYNDIQRAVGMPTIDEPWADEHLLTKNFGKAENVLKGEESGEET